VTASFKDVYNAGAIPNDCARQQRTIDHAIIKAFLYQKKAHYINKHKYCDDVKESMNDLIAEFESLVDEPKKEGE
jgi:hypothetical protein